MSYLNFNDYPEVISHTMNFVDKNIKNIDIHSLNLILYNLNRISEKSGLFSNFMKRIYFIHLGIRLIFIR